MGGDTPPTGIAASARRRPVRPHPAPSGPTAAGTHPQPAGSLLEGPALARCRRFPDRRGQTHRGSDLSAVLGTPRLEPNDRETAAVGSVCTLLPWADGA